MTSVLRNQLVGISFALTTINIARGRDTGARGLMATRLADQREKHAATAGGSAASP